MVPKEIKATHAHHFKFEPECLALYLKNVSKKINFFLL
jgi:hypothetical protein